MIPECRRICLDLTKTEILRGTPITRQIPTKSSLTGVKMTLVSQAFHQDRLCTNRSSGWPEKSNFLPGSLFPASLLPAPAMLPWATGGSPGHPPEVRPSVTGRTPPATRPSVAGRRRSSRFFTAGAGTRVPPTGSPVSATFNFFFFFFFFSVLIFLFPVHLFKSRPMESRHVSPFSATYLFLSFFLIFKNS